MEGEVQEGKAKQIECIVMHQNILIGLWLFLLKMSSEITLLFLIKEQILTSNWPA